MEWVVVIVLVGGGVATRNICRDGEVVTRGAEELVPLGAVVK